MKTGQDQNYWKSLWRVLGVVLLFFLAMALAHWLWQPGKGLRDGRHDRQRNGIWMAHGWLGADDWFIQYNKTHQFDHYRNLTNIQATAALLRKHHISDVFPHLCPATPQGRLPAVHPGQVERFLDAFAGFRVIPWVGGPNGGAVNLANEKWRINFVADVQALLTSHPRLAGIQINIEPLPDGDEDFLRLLEELRRIMPQGKILSVAAYPPPTRWHPYPDLHWSESYFRTVARRCDQMAVMMYDAAQRLPKTYVRLMADWTEEVLQWSEGREILLGVPTYDDAGVGYHDPRVENLAHALAGIHAGLMRHPVPTNYQGIALYCHWETDDGEWQLWREKFLRQP